MVPTLYITMGLPASGKTYFSQRFAEERDIFFLNVDNLRLAMVRRPTFEFTEGRMVYDTVTFIAEQHLMQGKSIICNGNYHVRRSRQEMKTLADKYDADFRILWIKTPYDVAKERITTREHEIPVEKMVHHPLELLEMMHTRHEAPTDDEPVIEIDGTRAYEDQRKALSNT